MMKKLLLKIAGFNSKNGTFGAKHILSPKAGVAVHINAFNFPIWGMLEKIAPTLLAGVPCIVKPATDGAQLTQAVVKPLRKHMSYQKAHYNSFAVRLMTC